MRTSLHRTARLLLTCVVTATAAIQVGHAQSAQHRETDHNLQSLEAEITALERGDR